MHGCPCMCWGSINKMSSKLDEVLSEHKEVFQEELGVFKNVKATCEAWHNTYVL